MLEQIFHSSSHLTQRKNFPSMTPSTSMMRAA